MKNRTLCLLAVVMTAFVFGDQNYNQTPDVTPVLAPTSLPFTVSIDLTEMAIPNGWHSGAVATWGSKCVLLAGRTNGLHGFDNGDNNFPPQYQNKAIIVLDFETRKVFQRSLQDASAGLSQMQIDSLSVTSPQSYQSGSTLYMTGGYGVDSATGQMGTKSVLTAIDIPGIINWVIKGKGSVAKNIRQITHPLLQVTGGFMDQPSPHMETLLIFGQNFAGFYNDSSNGEYTQQVRKFRILDNGDTLHIAADETQPPQNPAYRRRDLNVVPVMRPGKHNPVQAYIALSGVFTEAGGIWTVPVEIAMDGSSVMADPSLPSTFKQGMNNYASPTLGLFSGKTEDMYILIFGGITYGYFDNGIFKTDTEIPFTNQVTTVKVDRDNVYTQYLMANEYPTIYSTFSNPGNVLLFGAGADVILAESLPKYRNNVIALDKLKTGSTIVGYIVGGIQSTLPNTNTRADSAASPYVFQVTLNRG